MHELARAVPDVEVLLKLEPEQWPSSTYPGQQTAYPRDKRADLSLALSEAWAWLGAQGLIVPAGSQGQYGWWTLSRRARKFESEAEFANYAVARLLPREALHPKIAEKVWLAFMRVEFDVAAFQAMKAVEVAVRDATGLPDGLIGTKLMQ